MFTKKNNKAKTSDEIVYTEKINNQDMKLTSQNLRNLLSKSKDIMFQDFYINNNRSLKVTVLFIDGLASNQFISDDILKPLVENERLSDESINIGEVIDFIEHGIVYFPVHKKRIDINDVINDVIDCSCALIFDEDNTAITFDVRSFDKRSVTEPPSENVIKGARDCFVETLRVNTATVRRKIRTANLIIEGTIVGKQTLTPVSIVYIDGLTNPYIVEQVKERLNNIEVEGALTPNAIEENIIDNIYTTFPQIISTERPDRFCTNIIEGRVGLLIDGMPLTYIVPATISQFLEAAEDYSQNYLLNSIIKVMRYILAMITLWLPAFYVAVTTFHQEMIPTDLALAIEAAKENVPFPTFIEILFMIVAFEILQEAGVRLPQTIGQAVSIVGTLVVGQAAVEANLISPAIVVVTALTGTTGFTIPNQDFTNAIRIWRVVMIISASILGLVGLSFATIYLIYHLCKLETYEIPYLSPFVSCDKYNFKDTVFRIPYMFNKKRPAYLEPLNKIRHK